MSTPSPSTAALIHRIIHPNKQIRSLIKFLPLSANHPSSAKEKLLIRYQFVKTLFGKALIASTQKGICFFAFSDQEKAALKELTQRFPLAILKKQTSPLHATALRYLTRQPKTPTIPLHLKGTAFQLRVWEALLHIPFGKLSTYKSIARFIGHPNAYRAVGSAIGMNPVCFLIPCHRIIQANGKLGNYHWGEERKAAIVAWES